MVILLLAGVKKQPRPAPSSIRSTELQACRTPLAKHPSPSRRFKKRWAAERPTVCERNASATLSGCADASCC